MYYLFINNCIYVYFPTQYVLKRRWLQNTVDGSTIFTQKSKGIVRSGRSLKKFFYYREEF